jgi:hypothetical protein
MKVLSRQDPILSVTVACRFFARGDFARAQARPSRSKLRALPGRCRISVRQYRRTRDSSVRSTPSAEVPPVQCTLAADGRVSASHTKPRSLHIVLWYIECCCWFRACFAHVEPHAGRRGRACSGHPRLGRGTKPRTSPRSITSSAIASSAGGTSIPSARGVPKLMTNSNLATLFNKLTPVAPGANLPGFRAGVISRHKPGRYEQHSCARVLLPYGCARHRSGAPPSGRRKQC